MSNSCQMILEIGVSDRSSDIYRCLLQQGDRHTYQVLTARYDAPISALCRSQRVDSILLASYFPETHGFDVLKQLRAELGDRCPPIIVIDDNQAHLAVQAIKARAADYLPRIKLRLAPLKRRCTALSRATMARLNHLHQHPPSHLCPTIAIGL
ncbi:MAG: hypothetical protein ACFB4J_17825 [Elainellaceae cyanobacterium]